MKQSGWIRNRSPKGNGMRMVLFWAMFSWVTSGEGVDAQDKRIVRFATFNCSLNRERAGGLATDLETRDNLQAQRIARILQQVRPDVLLLNEFDYDEEGLALKRFRENYLALGQGDLKPLEYGYSFTGPVNTGVDSGLDLNRDGKLGTADDAFGYGRHPGQYGMVVLSRFPIESNAIRTFQRFRWRDMPNALWPVVPETGEPYYSEEIASVFRLSSKSHWDVPIQIGAERIHFLVCHPTPPVFDGDEDRNGMRNHDEIRLWADYVGGAVDGKGRADYLYDDQGRRGGLDGEALFVIAGDMNADPVDGDHREGAIDLLLKHPRIQDPQPASEGGGEQARLQGGKNAEHRGDPRHDTGDFNDRSVGNLRIDYVLPSKEMVVRGAGVFWPTQDRPDFDSVQASDHRLVWVDLEMGKPPRD